MKKGKIMELLAEARCLKERGAGQRIGEDKQLFCTMVSGWTYE